MAHGNVCPELDRLYAELVTSRIRKPSREQGDEKIRRTMDAMCERIVRGLASEDEDEQRAAYKLMRHARKLERSLPRVFNPPPPAPVEDADVSINQTSPALRETIGTAQLARVPNSAPHLGQFKPLNPLAHDNIVALALITPGQLGVKWDMNKFKARHRA